MGAIILTKLRVENFDSFKAQYDRGEGVRRELDARSVQLLRDASDPNLVTVVTRFDSVDAAKRMVSSDKWKQAAKGSAVGPMEASFHEIAEEKTY